MKVHRVVSYPAAFSELIELNSLNLELLEALSEHNMAAKVLRRVGFGRHCWSDKISQRHVTARHDADVARQQPHRGPRIHRREIAHPAPGWKSRRKTDHGSMMRIQQSGRRYRNCVADRVCGEIKVFGVRGQVVRRRDDDVVAFLPAESG